jgi:hypothetical protein
MARVQFLVGHEILTTPQHPNRLWGPPNLPFNRHGGGGGTGVKHQRCVAECSPPSGAKVKAGGAIPPSPHTFSWHGTYLVKRRYFTFTLINVKLSKLN